MKRLILVPAILFVLIVLGAFPAGFATNSRPFNGTMLGSGIATSATTNSITATVHLQHLGKSMLVGTTMVTGVSECGGFVGIEKDTITAANGDQVFVSGNGVSCPVSSNWTVFHDTVTFTVTGGTGRFAGSSGSGTTMTTIVITSPAGASTFTAIIAGTITY